MLLTRDAVTGTVDREIVFTRRLDAPRDLVFRAWTEPEHVARWQGPIAYREILPPERLVYDHGERGAPGAFRVTVTFEALNGTTRLHMRMLFDSVAERDFVVEKYGAIQGGNQTLDRLAEYLETLR